MSIFTEMTKIRDKVAHILKQSRKSRDDDGFLYAAFVHYQLGKEKVRKMTCSQLLRKIANSKVPSFASISRVRRKLQEKYPEYRGERYSERHESATEVKKNIKDL